MKFISTNHQGGLCNVLFKLSAAISLAIDNNVEFIFSNEFIRDLDRRVVTKGFDDYRIYYTNVLRNIKFIDKLPETYSVWHEPGFDYHKINYDGSQNLLLTGYYQSEKYFINNKKTIIDLFKVTEEIKEFIYSKIPNINECISIHIRRGDYLNLPDYHPQQPIDYYQSAVNILGINKKYLIFSDDIDGIKELFNFIPNKEFISLGENYLDLYAISLCQDNIICNSTFGWWGAYLNENINKKVIAPKHWFGPSASFNNTKDIIPESWIKI